MQSVEALRFLHSPAIKHEAKGLAAVNGDETFDSVFKTALNMIKETNDLQNQAEQMEIQFALGDAVNTHDLSVAQQKANIALSYTVAVRDKVVEAYNSIINMQV